MQLHIKVKIQKLFILALTVPMLAFWSQKLESGEFNNWYIQSDQYLPRYTPSIMLLHVLGAKSRTPKHGLETPEATSSNLLVDKNIQSLKSE